MNTSSLLATFLHCAVPPRSIKKLEIAPCMLGGTAVRSESGSPCQRSRIMGWAACLWWSAVQWSAHGEVPRSAHGEVPRSAHGEVQWSAHGEVPSMPMVKCRAACPWWSAVQDMLWAR